LTIPFSLKFDQKPDFEQLVSNIWSKRESRGGYGHATEIPQMKKAFISNTPECLFQVKMKGAKTIVEALPIKGTIKLKQNDFKTAWHELSRSEKNEAELYMITDLLRNDLGKINAETVEVLELKAPLRVPGILHQYSRISVTCDKPLVLFDLVQAVFPGGSITGAPKKKVIEILEQLEQRKRGLYCGSTILMGKGMMAASINIRTAEWDLTEDSMRYQAGGGITLLSDLEEEWEEVLQKLDSFARVL
jgi:anthranilate/para-aminobenzoate synthase component I